MRISRFLQYAFIAIVTISVGFSLYQWNASRASTQKTAPNNGLVGYWSFNEGTGTQAGDASGNNNTGTFVNSPTWGTGKFGSAMSFNGSTNYVSVSDHSSLNPSVISISAWVYYVSQSGAGGGAIVSKYDNSGSNRSYLVAIDPGTEAIGALVSSAGSSGTVFNDNSLGAVPKNKWSHVVMTYDGANVSLYLNGVKSTTSMAYTGNLFDNNTALTIGARPQGSTGYFGGLIDEVRIYNRALSGTEVTNLYNLGAEKLNVSPVSNLTSGLVGYWTFDGKDTPWSSSSAGTATDRSGNSNTGTLTNMSQSTSPTIGKSGQALNFDGTDDYVNMGDASALKLTTAFTISAWINPRSFGGGSRGRIVDKKDAGVIGYIFFVDGFNLTNGIAFGVNNAIYGTATHRAVANAVTLNIWQHLVVSFDGTNVTFYKNGISLGSQTLSVPNVGTSNFAIGGKTSVNDRNFDGSIDDVRVYNRALSAGEVQSLYDLGASDKVNSSVSQNQGTGRLDSGLAGYWKLDENTGTTTTDASTNAATGTLTNGPTWTTGQIGSAVDFDGTDDYITAPDADTIDVIDATNFTVTGWFNRDTFTTDDTIVAKSNGQAPSDTGYNAYIDDATDKLTFVANDGTDQYKKESVSTFTATGWHHFALVWDDSGSSNTKLYIDGLSEATTDTGTFANVNSLANALTFRIGAESDSGNPFDGYIDEVRVYKRALSDDEVSQLYRLTAPTGVDTSLKGYWSFNGSDLSGTTAYDRSGAGNTGTLTNGPTKTIGKLGQALSFDGGNDRVVMASTPVVGFPVTTIVWFKTTNASASYRSISGIYGGSNSALALIQFDSGSGGCANSSRVKYIARDNSASTSANICSLSNVNDGTWHQAVGVSASASNHQLYIDGVSQGTSSSALGTTTFDTMWVGGYGGAQFFPGQIDEVRVYNRPLSATEVATLYNSGR